MTNIMASLNINYLLIEHYKKLNINEDELAVILVLNHLLSQHNQIVTADELSFKMNFDSKKIDEILAVLMRKKIISLEKGKNNMKLSLKPLQTKLFNCYKLDVLNEEQVETEETNRQIKNVYAIMEKELGRTLSPADVQRIREWFNLSYIELDILNAIKDLKVINKKVSIAAVDKVLLNKAKAKEINQEGITFLSDKWEKSLDETIKIAKTKWLEDE